MYFKHQLVSDVVSYKTTATEEISTEERRDVFHLGKLKSLFTTGANPNLGIPDVRGLAHLEVQDGPFGLVLSITTYPN